MQGDPSPPWSHSDESRSQGQKWCWWSGWLKVAEGLILKVVTGKVVGGWSEPAARGVPGSVPSKQTLL